MVEHAPVVGTQRVALLARPGKAADNLADALRQAGAELVLVADPNALDEAGLLASRPHAVLVALEPSVDHAIDRLDAALSAPGLTVIFDEADLAAHRAGWDAARWVRHLSAKLHRHQQVLPPGGEAETEEWHPSPGQLPKPAGDFAGLDLGAFAQEAAVRADAVPADGIQFDAVAKDPIANSTAMPVAGAIEAADAGVAASGTGPSSMPPPLPPLETLEIREPAPVAETTTEWVLDEAMELETDIPRGEDGSRTLEPPGLQPMQFDDDTFFLENLSAESSQGAAIEESSDLSFDFSLEPLPDEDAQGAAVGTISDLEFDLSTDFDDAPESQAAQPLAISATEADEEPAGFALDSFGGLSLAGDDTQTISASEQHPSEAPARDQSANLSALEARISHLSLVDIETESDPAPQHPVEAASSTEANPEPVSSMPPPIELMPSAEASVSPVAVAPSPIPTQTIAAGPAPTVGFRGIVLIEAGLGGPDPVRQVLAALPPTFPLPVLVRLHLQGGRYDRLVSQMERAASLPVVLASVGEHVRPGCIYFLPEGVGLRALSNGMEFIAHPSPARTIFAALPAEDSAVLFLSGSDSALIEDALQAAEAGALLVAQSPEDCYDGAACAHLRSQGATSGVPSELARRLLTHWTS